jgi:hypothetical protein
MDTLIKGFFGKVLHINLSSSKYWVEEIKDEVFSSPTYPGQKSSAQLFSKSSLTIGPEYMKMKLPLGVAGSE